MGYYLSCDCCGKSMYGDAVATCSVCEHNVCVSCVVNDDVKSNDKDDYYVKFDGTKEQKEKYRIDDDEYEIGDTIYDTGIDSKYCPFCNGTEVNDNDLFQYLLKKCNIDKDELMKEYLANR